MRKFTDEEGPTVVSISAGEPSSQPQQDTESRDEADDGTIGDEVGHIIHFVI